MTEYAKIKPHEMYIVTDHRAGAMRNPPGAMLELHVVTIQTLKSNSEPVLLHISLEMLESLIARLQDSLTQLRQAN